MVQSEIRAALDDAPHGPIKIVSACSGDGRDLFGALKDHPRRPDVRARLVERDPEVAASAASASPPTVEVRCADAGSTDAYLGAAPAQVVLMCGVFGNISTDHVQRTVRQLAAFCLPGGRVIWTRHRRDPDLTPQIVRWFHESGFIEMKFHAPVAASWSVGVHHYSGPPRAFVGGVPLFTFERPR